MKETIAKMNEVMASLQAELAKAAEGQQVSLKLILSKFKKPA